MSRYDDIVLGALAEIQAEGGDDLDLAEAIARVNPTADQLQHFANMRGIKHDLLNHQAPFGRNNPPSILKGSLGLQVTLKPLPDGSVVTRQVANWTGEDAETLPITVVVGSVVNPFPDLEGAALLGGRTWATLQFGTRASLLTAEIDIGRGFQLTVGGSMMTVQVSAQNPTAGSQSAFVQDPILSGMISFHPVIRTQNITRTVYIDNLMAATYNNIIPNFAKTLIFVKRNLTEAVRNALIVFTNSAATICGVYEIPANTQQTVPVPVPPDAYYFGVVQGTIAGGISGNNIGGAAVFNLEF